MTEFSIELLLFYLEFKQYKQYASEISGNETGLDDAPNVPQSSIIKQYKENTEMTDIVKLKHMVYDLYCKYIKIRSPFEINLSYLVRNNLIQLIDNRDGWLNTNIDADQLQNIFNSCSKEVAKLLRFSLNRAVSKHETLVSLCEHLNIKQETATPPTTFIEILYNKLMPVSSNSNTTSTN